MPDIRSFFGAKGDAPPAKPTPKKENDSAKKSRGKGRKVIEDSEEEDMPMDVKKLRTTPRKKNADLSVVEGVETSAAKYFASSKSKPALQNTTPKATSKTQARPAVEIQTRKSPRTKASSIQIASDPPKNARNGAAKKATTARKKYDDDDDDDDAFMDVDEDDGDDIFATEAKSLNKRKNGDYVEEESDDELLPKPKRVASRNQVSATAGADKAPAATNSKGAKNATPSATSKKRKPPTPADEEDEEEEKKPRKKATPAKPRAPRAQKGKEAEAEPDDIKAILDNLPTVEAPDAPPKDPNFKFDWKKHAAGSGNAGPPPMEAAVVVPEGEENCLAGKAFVFTGQLKTIGREEAQALVKRYGGKVTTAPSSKTDFVVLGDDAGPSKLRKIKELGIKTIDEVGLFYLIKSMPAHGGSGKDAEKAKQRQIKEEEKIREQAAEMEREEKARKVEAEKAKKAAASASGIPAPPASQPLSQLWTVKYAPTQLNHICGNKANVERIQSWLRNWSTAKKYDFQKKGADGMGAYRAIIISGPPGIGKTTAAHLAARLEGFDVLESNASDTRSKRLIESGISDVVNNTSLLGFFAGDGKNVDSGKKQIVLIMDEVDGMSAGDRGGVGALAKFCKKTEVPLILICNERKLPKMKPFDFVTFDIKFQRPTVDQIRSRIMTICHREGLKLPLAVVNSLIEGSNRDIRQIINMISTAKLDQSAMDFDQSKEMTKAWEKHVILKPWDICQKLLGSGLFSPASKATLNDKIELYFNDHEFSYLMIQENYLRTKPAALSSKGYNARETKLKYLELMDQAAESISDGDLVDRMIHGPQQHWSLMPTHAVFSTVKPSSLVSGQMIGTNFTTWLGNNSKAGKLGRFIREIHAHMRLRSSGDHNEVRQQYLPTLWYQIIKRLEVDGKDSVEDVIELMDSYYLTRDDFDAIKELGVGPQAEETVNIDTQTKSTFTRLYNSMAHPVPSIKASNVIAPKKLSKDVPDLEEAIEEEDEGDVVDPAEEADGDNDELDLKNDKYIKQPKPKAKGGAKKAGGKKPAKKAGGEDDGDEDEDGDATGTKTKAKGRGKPKKK